MSPDYTFPCGCSFKILKPADSPDKVPLLDFDIETVPEDCPLTWNMLSRGDTKGVFQLESQLGRTWCKQLKPETFDHMGALGSLLRPGALNAKDENGISMTKHYALRKNGQEEVTGYQPDYDQLVKDTYGVITYQEQLMAMGRVLAGFDLIGVDKLRKSVGKKDQKALAKVGEEFIVGCEKTGIVTKEQAEQIWEWIKASGRYLFNASHAVSYGVIGYQTAYIKAHFPHAFFTSWLKTAKGKSEPQQEIYELIYEAKLFDIEVKVPDLRDLQDDFHTDGVCVKFGLGNILGIGPAQLSRIKKAVTKAEEVIGKNRNDWTWTDFLRYCVPNLTSTAIKNLINAGALSWLDKDGLGRQQMQSQALKWYDLTEKEIAWFQNPELPDNLNIVELLELGVKTKKEGGACHNKNRVSTLQSVIYLLKNPPTVLVDKPELIATAEQQLLGVSVSAFRTDSTEEASVNCTVKEYLSGRKGFIVLGVEIKSVRELVTKRGASAGSIMAYLTVADSSGVLYDVVCFPDVWASFSHLLREDSLVILQGDRDYKSDTFIVKNAWQMIEN